MRIIKANDTVTEMLSVTIDGNAANPTGTPTAKLYINGVDVSATIVTTVTVVSVGLLSVSFTAPADISSYLGHKAQVHINGTLGLKAAHTVLEVGEFDTKLMSDLKDFDPASDKVTEVETCNNNTDMRGTDGAVTSLAGIATADNITAMVSALSAYGDSHWTTADVGELATSTAVAAIATAISELPFPAVQAILNKLNTMIEADGDSSKFTANAVSNAPVADLTANTTAVGELAVSYNSVADAVTAINDLQRADKAFVGSNAIEYRKAGTSDVIMVKALKDSNGDAITDLLSQMVAAEVTE